MDNEVLGRQGPEKYIQVPPSQPQRLGAGSGELNVVAGRNRPTDAIHGALQDLVLERERSCTQRKAGGHSECPPEDGSGAGGPPGSTVTTATSPSLLDRFHSSTLKCLNTLRKGCCQAAGEGTPPEHRSRAARRDLSPPPAGRASARGMVSDAAGTSSPGLPERETRRQCAGRAPPPPAMAPQLALPASADAVLRKTRITTPSNSRLATLRHFRQGNARAPVAAWHPVA